MRDNEVCRRATGNLSPLDQMKEGGYGNIYLNSLMVTSLRYLHGVPRSKDPPIPAMVNSNQGPAIDKVSVRGWSSMQHSAAGHK